MATLPDIEKDLIVALKAKDSVLVDTLRGLKVRVQNEKIAKLHDLSDDEISALIKSEIKRRKEAAQSFETGNRSDMAAKELTEAAHLEKYLPPQMSTEEVNAVVDTLISEHSFGTADFGKAMGMLKSQVGNKADGSLLAKILKEKLK